MSDNGSNPPHAQRSIGDWLVGAMLGSGSFAVVWKAQHRTTRRTAAIKEINLDRLNARLRQSLESEVSILQRISHPNIVQLYEVIEAHGRLFIVMEYCSGGDLAQLLKSGGKLTEPAVRGLMKDLSAGLREMWTHHLVHRDLKPQNLLLATPPSALPLDPFAPTPTLKIADFGFARALGPQLLAETLCGSPLYMAPEILLAQRYDAKADLWSVGTIMFEMLVGTPPYTGGNQVALLKSIREREVRIPPALAQQLSPPCRALVHALLRRNAVERISFDDFFSHAFVAGEGGAGGVSGDGGAFYRAPQHIVGFQGSGAVASVGVGMPPPAAVPVGQLTEQFRPRLVSMRHPVQQQQQPQRPHRPPPRQATPAEEDDDDEYVLVTAEPAAAAATVPAAAAATPPLREVGMPRSAPEMPQEAFLLSSSPSKDAAGEDGSGSGPAGRKTSLQEGEEAGGAVPWQTAGRRQFMRLVAGILDALGVEEAPLGTAQKVGSGRKSSDGAEEILPQEAATAAARQLSYHLAALQLYDQALKGPREERNGGEKEGLPQSMYSSAGSADSGLGGGDIDAARDEAAAALLHAEAAAAALQAAAQRCRQESEERRSASNAPADLSFAAPPELPNPWAAVHRAALRWAETAATEELLGNYARGKALYCQSGIVLHFLAAEARTLACQPAPQLTSADEARLRRCASATAARWAVCAAQARAEESSL